MRGEKRSEAVALLDGGGCGAVMVGNLCTFSPKILEMSFGLTFIYCSSYVEFHFVDSHTNSSNGVVQPGVRRATSDCFPPFSFSILF